MSDNAIEAPSTLAMVPAEIDKSGPTVEQLKLAREVIGRTATGDQFPGNESYLRVYNWLAERIDHFSQAGIKVELAHRIAESTTRGVSVHAAVLNGLNDFHLVAK